MAQVETIEWNIQTTSKTVTASMRFDSFEQSHRFICMIIDFIKREKKPPDILEDVAWYCPQALWQGERDA